MLLYIALCWTAHHLVMAQVKAFAAENHIEVERIGALPLPPSWLSWGGVIRSTNGVYQSRFDLRHLHPQSFTFTADSPAITDGATVSLYSDPANEAQGLWLLERAGLITLNPAADKWEATQKDIAANPKHLKFTLLDFAAQSRSLSDLDAAVGYTEYYLAAKVPISRQIFAPPAPDEFAGQLTIGSRWADTENVKNLVATFKDPAVQQFLATDPSVKNILLPL